MMGFDDTFMSDHDREMLLLARKDWIDALQDYHVTIRAFTIRERVDVAPPTTHANPVLREIARRWNGTFARAYSNRQFVVFSLPDKDQTSQKKLNSVIDITSNILHKYGPVLMKQGHPDVKMRPLYVFSWGMGRRMPFAAIRWNLGGMMGALPLHPAIKNSMPAAWACGRWGILRTKPMSIP
jgi:hypothetical protein